MPDDWLFKLVPYDSAALYRLSSRYFLLDAYSSEQFELFYRQYLYETPDISLWLLDLYSDSGKRNQLIQLCLQSDFTEDYIHKFTIHRIADSVGNMSNPDEILDVYDVNSNEGVILLKIAGNVNSSKDLLLKLANIKGVSLAKQIRVKSRDTLKFKQYIK